MLSDPYVIYSLRMQAWISTSGGTSDYKLAKVFSREDALAYCKKLRDHTGATGAIPALLADLEGATE